MAEIEELSFSQKLGLGSSDAALPPDDEAMAYFCDPDRYQAYQVWPAIKPEMLVLNFKSGLFEAFDYAHLSHVRYEPSEGGISLGFIEFEVSIAGLRLLPLARQLSMRRVFQLFEADKPTAMAAQPEETVITEMVSGKRVTPLE